MAEIYENTLAEAARIGWNRFPEHSIGDSSKKFVVHDHNRGQFYFTDEDHIEELDGIRAMAMFDQVAIDFRREGFDSLAEATEKASRMGDQHIFKRLYDIMNSEYYTPMCDS